MKKKKFTALVPVRKGSQRVKNKNIKNFGGTSLLELKIKNLKKIKLIDEIIVNSDSDEMLNIGEKLGTKTFKRSDYFASSTVNNSEFFQHIAENTDTDIIMYSPVTCPFIKEETYNHAIKKFNSFQDEHDSLMTTFYVHHHMWLDNKPINYDPTNAPNSQDLPPIMGLSYAISIISKDLMMKRRNVVGSKPFFIPLIGEESIDIDTELEITFAEHIYKKKLK